MALKLELQVYYSFKESNKKGLSMSCVNIHTEGLVAEQIVFTVLQQKTCDISI